MKQIEAAFDIAKRVFEKELSQTEGANRLNSENQVNINSAKIMITVYAKMIHGSEFKRALSAPDMRYYLAQFLEAGGSDSIRNPVKALWQHIEYYESKNQTTLNALRSLYEEYSNISNKTPDLNNVHNDFMEAVEEARKLPKKERKERLEHSSKTPKSRSVVVNVYERNPDVVVEVLERANGICERCNTQAPFYKRKDNSPYLEIHHKVRLADGGEDSVENAIALCPNCHRELHFGVVEV